MKEIALVVPSIREESWKRFVKEWSAVGLFDRVDTILVEDNPKKTFVTNLADVYHFCWEDIELQLGDKSWVIPRRSDTVRSFGYWLAWRGNYRYILTLDDDCYPPTDAADDFHYDKGAEGFLNTHLQALTGGTRWFNTLTQAKPRGVPYYNLGKRTNVVVNHGLWTNVLDYDAPTQLANPTKEKFSFDSRVVPLGQYFPMCGMNVMWRREVTVLMYHLLMGKIYNGSGDAEPLDPLPFDRFGDIWCGIFMKKIADTCGLCVSTGMPYIHHDRASNPFTNLKKEANGIEVNERLWEYVDNVILRQDALGALPFQNAYWQLGNAIGRYREFPQYEEYFRRLGDAMMAWAELFQ